MVFLLQEQIKGIIIINLELATVCLKCSMESILLCLACQPKRGSCVSSCYHDCAAPDQESIEKWAEGYKQTIQQFGLDISFGPLQMTAFH